MRKTITALILTLGLLLCCLCGAQASSLSKAELYEAYQTELHRYFDGDQGMTLEQLQSGFDELNYKKSVLFSYYVAILRDAELERFDNLSLYLELIQPDEDFLALLEEKEFPSLGELNAYALGRQAESKGDWPAAIEYYKDSSAVLDSVRRRAALRTAGPTATPAPTKSPYVTATNVRVGDYEIDTRSDGTCVLTAYWGASKNPDVLVPSHIGGYRVTEIGNFAFYQTGVTSVTLPEGLIAIGNNAFQECSKLTDVHIPSTTTTLGSFAFIRSDIKRVNLPNSVIALGDNPFSSTFNVDIKLSENHPCLRIIDGVLFDISKGRLICYPESKTSSNYAIPNFVQSIDAEAFYSSDLITIHIPDSVTAIGDYAFSYCGSLESITLPDSVTSMGINPFRGCKQLRSIFVSSTHPTLKFINGSLINKTDKRLICYVNPSQPSEYVVPEGVSIIGSHFTHLDLSRIILPDSVTCIDDYAFDRHEALTSINIPNSVTHIGSRAFRSCKALTTLTIPPSVTSFGDSTFIFSTHLTLYVEAGSAAEAYAIRENIPYHHTHASPTSAPRDFYVSSKVTMSSGVATIYWGDSENNGPYTVSVTPWGGIPMKYTDIRSKSAAIDMLVPGYEYNVYVVDRNGDYTETATIAVPKASTFVDGRLKASAIKVDINYRYKASSSSSDEYATPVDALYSDRIEDSQEDSSDYGISYKISYPQLATPRTYHTMIVLRTPDGMAYPEVIENQKYTGSSSAGGYRLWYCIGESFFHVANYCNGGISSGRYYVELYWDGMLVNTSSFYVY